MTDGNRHGSEVAVLGAGSWGTTLALVLARKGIPVRLWAYEEEVVRSIRDDRENTLYLPGIRLPETLRPEGSEVETVRGANVVVSVTPAQHVDAVMGRVAGTLDPDALIITASKGIEISTLRMMDEVMASHLLPDQHLRLTALSGPTFAGEVAREVPSAIVAASRDRSARLRTQALFGTERFRVYTNSDIIGVELGGAVKNVIALAAGVAAGLGFGHNTLAALITRGLAEIARLGVAMGARAPTFRGLSGVGDLVLTCTGELSRNRTVGRRLGKGESLDAILGEMRMVAEGVSTAPAVRALARREGVEMPIVEEVCAILEGRRDPGDAVEGLMLRPPRSEEAGLREVEESEEGADE